jgi:hypothetical protein
VAVVEVTNDDWRLSVSPSIMTVLNNMQYKTEIFFFGDIVVGEARALQIYVFIHSSRQPVKSYTARGL